MWFRSGRSTITCTRSPSGIRRISCGILFAFARANDSKIIDLTYTPCNISRYESDSSHYILLNTDIPPPVWSKLTNALSSNPSFPAETLYETVKYSHRGDFDGVLYTWEYTTLNASLETGYDGLLYCWLTNVTHHSLDPHATYTTVWSTRANRNASLSEEDILNSYDFISPWRMCGTRRVRSCGGLRRRIATSPHNPQPLVLFRLPSLSYSSPSE